MGARYLDDYIQWECEQRDFTNSGTFSGRDFKTTAKDLKFLVGNIYACKSNKENPGMLFLVRRVYDCFSDVKKHFLVITTLMKGNDKIFRPLGDNSVINCGEMLRKYEKLDVNDFEIELEEV